MRPVGGSSSHFLMHMQPVGGAVLTFRRTHVLKKILTEILKEFLKEILKEIPKKILKKILKEILERKSTPNS